MNCKKMMTSLTAAALCVSLAACGSTAQRPVLLLLLKAPQQSLRLPLRLHRQNLLLKLPAAEK